MNNTATNIVALEKPRIVGHVQLDPRTVATPPPARPSSAPAADGFLAEQLKPEALRAAAEAAGHPLTLRLQPGYDHSYYFIASFIEDHLRHHARALAG